MIYKNWAEISEIEDKRLMIAIACVDLNSSDGAYLATLGRPWFTDNPVEQIRYPLSVVIETSKKEVAANRAGVDCWKDLAWWAQELKIPMITIGSSMDGERNEGDIIVPRDDKYPFRDEIYEPGDVVRYDNEDYVVMTDYRDRLKSFGYEYLTLAPLACIDPTK